MKYLAKLYKTNPGQFTYTAPSIWWTIFYKHLPLNKRFSANVKMICMLELGTE